MKVFWIKNHSDLWPFGISSCPPGGHHFDTFHKYSYLQSWWWMSKRSEVKTSELLCSELTYNVFNGVITLQWTRFIAQTQLCATCVTLSSTLPVFILHSSLYINLPSPPWIDTRFVFKELYFINFIILCVSF